MSPSCRTAQASEEEELIMAENKGKPSGKVAGSKTGAGSRTSARTKSEQAHTGRSRPDLAKDRWDVQEHPAGEGGVEHNAGGPAHRGAGAHEDRNP
jgi:hypothetical protein